MLIKAIALSAAAGLLLTSAAQAEAAKSYTDKTAVTQKGPQDTSKHMGAEHSAPMSSTSSMTVNPSSTKTPSADAATTFSSDVSATYPASTATALSSGGSVEIVASTPVADTPENRALYQPLSNTGRRTAPRGN